MRKYFFYTLIVLSLSLSSCFSANQRSSSDAPINASNNTAQNSQKPTQAEKAETGESGKTDQISKKSSPDTSAATTQNSSSEKFENRCGWYENPTPANVSLVDRDGEWIIGVQGGYQVDSDVYPDFKDDQWVKTNVNYGYGCACLRVKVDHKTHRILEIASATAKPLSACRNDSSLPKRED